MKKYYSIIMNSALFSNISINELELALNCLSPITKEFQKDETILHTGNNTNKVGIVLLGSVHIIKNDFWGNQRIISKIEPSQLFGESFACFQKEPLNVDVVACENSIILFLDINKILTTCSSACIFHNNLIRNLITVLAQKNLLLTKKIEHLTQKTTREKLLSYLSHESIKNNSSTFTIPFNRQQLANYLSVDRSSMSNELCKLRDEGIIKFHKNEFQLFKNNDDYI